MFFCINHYLLQLISLEMGSNSLTFIYKWPFYEPDIMEGNLLGQAHYGVCQLHWIVIPKKSLKI